MRLADCGCDGQVPSTVSSYPAVFGAVQLAMGRRTIRIRILSLDKASTSIQFFNCFISGRWPKVKRACRQSMRLSLIVANESLLDARQKLPAPKLVVFSSLKVWLDPDVCRSVQLSVRLTRALFRSPVSQMFSLRLPRLTLIRLLLSRAELRFTG